MKKATVWFAMAVVLSVIVFSGKCIVFTHFWQAWEFLAALTAMLYNGSFAVFIYTSHDQDGEGTLKNAPRDGSASFWHIILRVIAPMFCFLLTAAVVFSDRHCGPGPIESPQIFLKLGFTLAAFVAICLGDYKTTVYLREIAETRNRTLSAWIGHFKTHLWLIDAPFVLGYAGLNSI